MDPERVAAAVCLGGSLAVLVVLGAPYLLISEPGTGLGLYYGAGPFGGGAVAVLAVLVAIVLFAGTRGSADAQTAAGVVLVLGVATLALAVSWASAVSMDVVYSFPAAWMEDHRWLVVALAAAVAVGTVTYARAVLQR